MLSTKITESLSASVIKIKIAKVEEINAPSYHLFPDMPDADRRAAAMKNYGVKPV